MKVAAVSVKKIKLELELEHTQMHLNEHTVIQTGKNV